MTIDEAFARGFNMLRELGLPVKGTDIQAIAVYNVFHRIAAGKVDDPRFAEQGPLYVKRLLLEAYSK